MPEGIEPSHSDPLSDALPMSYGVSCCRVLQKTLRFKGPGNPLLRSPSFFTRRRGETRVMFEGSWALGSFPSLISGLPHRISERMRASHDLVYQTSGLCPVW